MPAEIALLTNPTSGKGRGIRLAEQALPRLRDAGYVVRNLVGRDADEALDLARQCVADGVETLAVVGGDGMVHLALQALAGRETRLGLIPAGTGNDVARYFDIPRKDAAAATDVVIGGQERRVDLARIGSTYFVTRARRRVRRHRQRAGQRDDLAQGADALQPGHPRRAAHVQPDPLRARGRRASSTGSRR